MDFAEVREIHTASFFAENSRVVYFDEIFKVFVIFGDD